MKILYSWLKDFVDIDVSATELADKLLSVGFEVEEIINLADSIVNVKTGKITDIKPHENADKLVVCQLDVGDEKLQIVTGAKNVSVGDVVPVATDGAILPDGKKIRTGELRGVLSQGMLCSGEELGLTEADMKGAGEYGILILPENTEIGVDFNQIIGNDDTILDISVTANRPDCHSVLGIAHEVAAVLKKPLKMPNLSYNTVEGDMNIKVENSATDLCPRYRCAVVNNVVIKDSPAVIRKRLKAVGIRPINNMVDITNYVLFEIGQPMHAFDRRLIDGDTIVVRRAFDGEKIVTLDEKENVLTSDMLVIADKNKANAVAGIMGGLNSGIQDDTASIVFESAKFARDNVRRTSKKLNLRSDSSARFEKGIDFNSQELALDRALAMICEQNAGEIVHGFVDNCVEYDKERTVCAKISKIRSILGIEISTEFIKDTLDALCIYTEINGDDIFCKIPAWRDDVSTANDLAEEIIRFYGYDTIEASLFNDAEQTLGGKTEKQKAFDKIASRLQGMGYYETVTYSFTTEKSYELLNLAKDNELRKSAKLLNPLGEDWSVMRTTLAHSMLATVESNVKKRNLSGRLYEIAKVYLPKTVPMTEQPVEKSHLVFATFGKDDFFTVKGALIEILSAFGIDAVTDLELVREDVEFLHPGRSASVVVKGKKLGYIGEIHPDVLENYEITEKVCMVEIDVDDLFDVKDDTFIYKHIPKYPAVERDFAFVMNDEVAIGGIIRDVTQNVPFVEDIEIFDIYRGERVEAGKKSVAVKIVFRSLDHTLTEAELEEIHAKVVKLVSEKYSAELRG